MKPEERIDQLENLLKQQQDELAALRKEVTEKREPDLRPYEGKGWRWDINTDTYIESFYPIPSIVSRAYARYPTKEMAEWQGKRERAIRKLQHLAVRLNPKGWVFSNRAWWIEVKIGSCSMDNGICFHSAEARDIAEKEMGDDLQYLNWYNSPEAKGKGV